MTQSTSCRWTDERTAEELTEIRLSTLGATEYWGLAVFRALGVRTIDRAGLWIAMVDANFCPTRCKIDPEHPDTTRPRIRRHDVMCPVCGHKSPLRKICAPAMKTPKKRQAFAEKAQPNVPEDPDWVIVETGPNYSRRGLSTDTQQALDSADATPDEPFRICIIRCRDAARATEIADERGDSLPWVTGIRLRRDDSLPANWHGGALSPREKELLMKQEFEDRAAKRSRREKAIRDMRREAL